MAGIAVTVRHSGAPQSGTQTIYCSAPATLGAVEAAIDASNKLLQVTISGYDDPNSTMSKSAYIGLDSVVMIVGT